MDVKLSCSRFCGCTGRYANSSMGSSKFYCNLNGSQFGPVRKLLQKVSISGQFFDDSKTVVFWVTRPMTITSCK